MNIKAVLFCLAMISNLVMAEPYKLIANLSHGANQEELSQLLVAQKELDQLTQTGNATLEDLSIFLKKHPVFLIAVRKYIVSAPISTSKDLAKATSRIAMLQSGCEFIEHAINHSKIDASQDVQIKLNGIQTLLEPFKKIAQEAQKAVEAAATKLAAQSAKNMPIKPEPVQPLAVPLPASKLAEPEPQYPQY